MQVLGKFVADIGLEMSRRELSGRGREVGLPIRVARTAQQYRCDRLVVSPGSGGAVPGMSARAERAMYRREIFRRGVRVIGASSGIRSRAEQARATPGGHGTDAHRTGRES